MQVCLLSGCGRGGGNLLLVAESVDLFSEPAHVVREEHHRADRTRTPLPLVIRQQSRHLGRARVVVVVVVVVG